MTQSFWSLVATLSGQRLQTSRGRSFDVVRVMAESLEIAVASTGKSRVIARHELEGAVALKVVGTPVRPIDLREHGASEMNPAYVAAIINRLLS